MARKKNINHKRVLILTGILFVLILVAAFMALRNEGLLQKELRERDARLRETPKNLSVSLAVGNKVYQTTLPAKITLYGLMEKLSKETDFRFKGKEYKGLGFFVEEINGLKGSGGKYWVYTVNGQKSDAGVSSYEMRDQDYIKWELKKGEY